MSEDNNDKPIETPPPELEPEEPIIQIPRKPKPQLIDIQTEEAPRDKTETKIEKNKN